MTFISDIPGSGDAYARLVEGLRQELGYADVSAVAERIFEAERAEFHWEARVQDRYLGQHLDVAFDDDHGCDELARVAVLSFVAGRWHAGICLVDGEGCAVDSLWFRSFDERDDAEESFLRAR
jgi:hypothetical protein